LGGAEDGAEWDGAEDGMAMVPAVGEERKEAGMAMEAGKEERKEAGMAMEAGAVDGARAAWAGARAAWAGARAAWAGARAWAMARAMEARVVIGEAVAAGVAVVVVSAADVAAMGMDVRM